MKIIFDKYCDLFHLELASRKEKILQTKKHQLDTAAHRLRMANLHCSRAATTLIKYGLSTSAAQINTMMITLNEIAEKAEGAKGLMPVQQELPEIGGPLTDAANKAQKEAE